MKTKTELPTTRISERISAQMTKNEISIRKLAVKLKKTYETVRGIKCGRQLPSEDLLIEICDALWLDKKEMIRLLAADKIRKKFGTIPFELAGKNPELEPIERVWNNISDEHKEDLIAMANTYAERDSA